MIDWSSGSDKQGDPGPLDTTSNGLDEHLVGGVGFDGVHPSPPLPEHKSQIAKVLKCRGRLSHP